MIKIFAQDEKSFIWNADDVYKLRTEHRIVGSLVGCYPRQAFQNSRKWLPLQLMPEEVKLLVDKDIAQLVSNPAVNNDPDPEAVKLFMEMRKKSCEEQIEKFKDARIKIILEKSDEILKGKRMKHSEGFEHKNIAKKRRKRMRNVNQSEEANNSKVDADEEASVNKDNADNSSTSEEDQAKNDKKERDDQDMDSPSHDEKQESKNGEELDSEKKALLEEEIARIPNISQDTCLVQLFTECLWKKEEDNILVIPNFPRTAMEKIRYAVFKDLWEKGFYLTSGIKFGGDFLVYAGDPVKFHALYIVSCLSNTQNFYGEDLITYGRMGNQVKKTFLLATLSSSGSVEYLSLRWAPDMVSLKEKTNPIAEKSMLK